MEAKKPWQSKTLWMALLGAIFPFFPGANAWVVGHAETYAAILSGVFMALRFITKEKISIE